MNLIFGSHLCLENNNSKRTLAAQGSLCDDVSRIRTISKMERVERHALCYQTEHSTNCTKLSIYNQFAENSVELPSLCRQGLEAYLSIKIQ